MKINNFLNHDWLKIGLLFAVMSIYFFYSANVLSEMAFDALKLNTDKALTLSYVSLFYHVVALASGWIYLFSFGVVVYKFFTDNSKSIYKKYNIERVE